jgi:hypothetical protein
LALSVAEYCRLTQPQARKIAYEVASDVSRWRQEATGVGIAEREIEMLASAFEHEDFAQAQNFKVSKR